MTKNLKFLCFQDEANKIQNVAQLVFSALVSEVALLWAVVVMASCSGTVQERKRERESILCF